MQCRTFAFLRRAGRNCHSSTIPTAFWVAHSPSSPGQTPLWWAYTHLYIASKLHFQSLCISVSPIVWIYPSGRRPASASDRRFIGGVCFSPVYISFHVLRNPFSPSYPPQSGNHTLKLDLSVDKSCSSAVLPASCIFLRLILRVFCYSCRNHIPAQSSHCASGKTCWMVTTLALRPFDLVAWRIEMWISTYFHVHTYWAEHYCYF